VKADDIYVTPFKHMQAGRSHPLLGFGSEVDSTFVYTHPLWEPCVSWGLDIVELQPGVVYGINPRPHRSAWRENVPFAHTFGRRLVQAVQKLRAHSSKMEQSVSCVCYLTSTDV
jgi:hypothetical protein